MQQHRPHLRSTLALVLVIVMAFGPLDTAAAENGAEVASAEFRGGVVVNGGDAEGRAIVQDALVRFAESGLELPSMQINIRTRNKELCHGYRAYWEAGSPSDVIDLCFFDTFTVLHELAHAWDHFTLTDDIREDFMGLTPGQEWRSDDVKYNSQGIEAAANTVAKQLTKPRSEVSDPAHAHAHVLDGFDVLTSDVAAA